MRTDPRGFADKFVEQYQLKYKLKSTETPTEIDKTISHLKIMMDLPPLEWSEKLEKWAKAYFELPEDERDTDISDRLANIGVDREVLSTEIIVSNQSTAFDLMVSLLKDSEEELNMNREKLLFSQFSHIGIEFSSSTSTTWIVLTNKKILTNFQ